MGHNCMGLYSIGDAPINALRALIHRDKDCSRGMYMGVCVDMCTGKCADMCADMCTEICAVRTYMCTGMW